MQRQSESPGAALELKELLPALAVASAVVVLHLFTNSRYGFHRDELQLLADAHHLDWGFIEYPPLTPFLARISMSLFGLSLTGLRLFSVIAQAVAVVFTALMARELGGGRLAQIAAALGIALSPIPLFDGTEFQYSSLDYMWWVLAAYFTIRLLKSENPRWWLAVGAVAGLGLLTKYSILFFVAGVISGLIFTPARRFLTSGWFWGGGGAVALLLFFPNFLWQFRHGFASYRFLEYIHNRDVNMGRADGFLINQLLLCINLVAAPLCLIGLVSYLRNQRFRMLAWMYLTPLVLLFFGKARYYYLAPAYPMLLAMGSVACERWVVSDSAASPAGTKSRRQSRGPRTRAGALTARRTAEVVFFAGVAMWGAWICAIMLPIQSRGPLRNFALNRNVDLREEFGWNDLAQSVAQIRDSLPVEERTHLGIIAANYGEQGALEILGPAYHLPPATGAMNSAWLRGYPTPQPTALIVVGFSRDEADALFTNCRLAAINTNSEGVIDEENQNHPFIFACGPPRMSWPEFWTEIQVFG
jgi:hypothetical protein